MRTKKITEQSVSLKYTGSLGNSDSVYLHYGIGESWENVTECKMRKLKTCYKTEVTVPTGTEFKFCFRDGNGNWDNNYGSDYSCTTTTTGEVTPVTTYSTVEVSKFTPKTTK